MDSQNCWLQNNCSKQHCNDVNGCLILYKLNYLYNKAGVPLNLRRKRDLVTDGDGTDVSEFRKLKEIQDNILEFVNTGKNLYIHSSNCGNGKTSWSLRLLQSFFNKIWFTTALKCRAIFINVPNFLLQLKEDIGNKTDLIKELKDNIRNCDLVIWDDIATKSTTVFEAENLLSLLEYRVNQGKANIFTSNLDRKELSEALGDRLASRICNLSIDIEFHGGDKRLLNAR